MEKPLILQTHIYVKALRRLGKTGKAVDPDLLYGRIIIAGGNVIYYPVYSDGGAPLHVVDKPVGQLVAFRSGDPEAIRPFGRTVNIVNYKPLCGNILRKLLIGIFPAEMQEHSVKARRLKRGKVLARAFIYFSEMIPVFYHRNMLLSVKDRAADGLLPRGSPE